LWHNIWELRKYITNYCYVHDYFYVTSYFCFLAPLQPPIYWFHKSGEYFLIFEILRISKHKIWKTKSIVKFKLVIYNTINNTYLLQTILHQHFDFEDGHPKKKSFRKFEYYFISSSTVILWYEHWVVKIIQSVCSLW
jgi:hypothetical protein